MDSERDSINMGSGGHGTHKERGKAPTDFRPLVLEWADFFRRAAELAEHDLAMERGEAPRPTMVKPGRVDAKRKKERDRRIARSPLYIGRRPEFVAYMEGVSVTLVKDARTASRLDPLSGERGERPETAPAEDQLKAYNLGGRATA